MRIAIDIDDCITNTSEVDFEICYEYFKKLHPDNHNHFINNYHNAPTIFGMNKQEDDDFFIYERKLCIEQDLIKPKVFAKKIITQLINDGHTIIILTVRDDLCWGNAQLEAKKWLDKYKIPYNQLFSQISQKGEFCYNNIDILIDDNLKYIKQCNDLGIRTITYDNNYNAKYYADELQNYSNKPNHYSSCWNEVYDKIKEIENQALLSNRKSKYSA